MRPLRKMASWNTDFLFGNIFDHISMISEYSSLVHLICNSDPPKTNVILENDAIYVCVDKDCP